MSEPAMRKMKVVVLGHFDSRGGTTAMPLPDEPEVSDVLEAMHKYDEDVFQWSTLVRQYDEDQAAGKGNWTWNPHEEEDNRPSHQDFFYVAELHYPEGTDLGEDLDEDPGFVLKEEGTDSMPETAQLSPGKASLEDVIRYFIEKPVQLEAVRLDEGFDKDLDEAEEFNTESLRAARLSKSEDLTRKFTAIVDLFEAERELRIQAKARVLKNPRTERWNDDAYGFLVGTGGF